MGKLKEQDIVALLDMHHRCCDVNHRTDRWSRTGNWSAGNGWLAFLRCAFPWWKAQVSPHGRFGNDNIAVFDGMDRAVWFFEDRADAEAYRDQTGRPDFCVLFDLDEDEVLGKPGRPPAVTTPHP